jgi:hypothetical protein
MNNIMPRYGKDSHASIKTDSKITTLVKEILCEYPVRETLADYFMVQHRSNENTLHDIK